ncbi:MAG TPA: metallophosphoesterase [Candidatus Limnocylindrales bacterium]|nr:metallophosphoesterase [Candidatus Limnocylindrales bacterium]
MIRHLVVPWPDHELADRLGRPFRLLAVSDDEDPALDRAVNRDGLAPVDLVVGCGDLSPEYLSFVTDSLRAPLLYVRGNHDQGAAWVAEARKRLPLPLGPQGAGPDLAAGLSIVGLGWPRVENEQRVPDERAAWLQAIRAVMGRGLVHGGAGRGRQPLIVLSHVPPRGYGDMPDSNYHRGFAGYRWLLGRLRPALWLHGHVHPAAAEAVIVQAGPTPIINVTGVTLLSLDPDATSAASPGHEARPDVYAATRAAGSAAPP